MGDFTSLLSSLARTCQDLEQIKVQHTKDHEKVSRSFEKTLLSILKQEQSILNHVEEEHRCLRDQLASIQRDNELALQNGVCEINGMVHKICNVSSQVKQALVTSSSNEIVMKQIQSVVSDIFSKKNSINIRLKKVHFAPQPLQTLTLGEIRCEEETLGFSLPSMKKKTELHWCKRARNQPALLSDETPPWEDKSHHPEGCVAGTMEDDSDQESVSTTNQSSVDLKKQHEGQRLNLSPRDLAVMEADSAALSPRVATKIWITDGKNTIQRLNKKPLGMKAMVANGDPANKACNQNISSKETIGSHRKHTFKPFQSSSKHQLRPQGFGTRKETMTKLESDILSSLEESRNQQDTNPTHEEVSITFPEHNTLFRATAAYVCEEESESSEDTVEDVETDGVRDPKACRQLVLRDSRVPSAKKQSEGEEDSRWDSMDSNSQLNEFGEDSLVSYLNKHNLESSEAQARLQTMASGIDYMRMSDEASDSLSGDFLSVPPRSCSPSESVKSSYTFIIESPKKIQTEVRSSTFSRTVSRSSNPCTRESRKRPPVITLEAEKPEIKSRQQTLTRLDGKQRPGSKIRNQRLQGNWKPVPRSSSMPYIEKLFRPHTAPLRSTRPASAKERRDSASSSSSTWSNPRSVATSTPSNAVCEIRVRVKSSQYTRKLPKTQQRPGCLSGSEPNLTDCLPHTGGEGVTKLVRQFGKFGSGRAELNLPHGISVTSGGSIYIVDYGNRRLQVMNTRGKLLQQFALETNNYFDVAVSNRGLVALTNSSKRSVDVYSKHGRLLQVLSRNWGAPRGITANYRDEFIVADMKLGTVCALTLDPSSGHQKESTVVPGFNKPYLVASNSQGLLAVSERGLDGGCCVKVLGEDWQILKVLGLRSSLGPTLYNPWGVCMDSEGGVLVVDWAQAHSIIYYPTRNPARVIVREGLSSPRGLALWQDGLLLVADSMHNCIKVFQYQEAIE
ncbi:hypothetical protein GDO78_023142 [Eleutherodactylus coqui]|uniref:Uncharacterized protein n=1 Tax=Eleutherodactylus coqui TaxID=57060 RepID=A0A8J6EFI9_ELECQ|nr:hypothetical protein GDO78_023142 [Eleutherodactylus coqui]